MPLQSTAETFAVWPAKAGKVGSVGFHHLSSHFSKHFCEIFWVWSGRGPHMVTYASEISTSLELGTVRGWTETNITSILFFALELVLLFKFRWFCLMVRCLCLYSVELLYLCLFHFFFLCAARRYLQIGMLQIDIVVCDRLWSEIERHSKSLLRRIVGNLVLMRTCNLVISVR